MLLNLQYYLGLFNFCFCMWVILFGKEFDFWFGFSICLVLGTDDTNAGISIRLAALGWKKYGLSLPGCAGGRGLFAGFIMYATYSGVFLLPVCLIAACLDCPWGAFEFAANVYDYPQMAKTPGVGAIFVMSEASSRLFMRGGVAFGSNIVKGVRLMPV
jgi:hypothetical protein